MRNVLLFFVFLMVPTVAIAQAGIRDPTQLVPHIEVAAGYDFIKANAPPGGCACFGLNGGFLSVGVP